MRFVLSRIDISTLSQEVINDTMRLIVGERIGIGQSREVNVYLPDTSLVIKMEHEVYKYDNVQEWEMWRASEGQTIRKWLAPCITISERGCALIQKRTHPVPEWRLPKKVPRLLTDTKKENWGLIERGGKSYVVCHDYAHNRMWKYGIEDTVMEDANWHSKGYAGYLK